MTGPIPSLVPGNKSSTASASTCAALWRIGPSSPEAPWSISSVALPRSGASRYLLVRYRDVAAFRHVHVDSRESANPSSLQDERSVLPRSHPRSRGRGGSALSGRANGRSRAGSPAAHGWCRSGSIVGLPAGPGSLAIVRIGRRVPIDAVRCVVGDTGLEPVTSCMSSKCSNQLS